VGGGMRICRFKREDEKVRVGGEEDIMVVKREV
jgi:hypothetical protein